MNLAKQLITNGDGVTFPAAGDRVGVHYVCWLFDKNSPGGRGNQ